MSVRSSVRLTLAAAAVALTALPSTASTQNPAATAIDRFMTRAAEYGQFSGGIMVADRGRVVYERAFGLANIELGAPNTTATRFEIASMTKPMTAIAVMQLVQEGKVRLDGRISDYLPWYPSETGRRISSSSFSTTRPASGRTSRSTSPARGWRSWRRSTPTCTRTTPSCD